MSKIKVVQVMQFQYTGGLLVTTLVDNRGRVWKKMVDGPNGEGWEQSTDIPEDPDFQEA